MDRSPPTAAPLLVTEAGGTITTYDRASGRQVWCTNLHTSPHSAELSIEPPYVVCLHHREERTKRFAMKNFCVITCFEYLTGRLLWQQQVEKQRQLPTEPALLVDAGQVLLSCGGLFAYALETGTPQWTAPIGEQTTHQIRLSVAGRLTRRWGS